MAGKLFYTLKRFICIIFLVLSVAFHCTNGEVNEDDVKLYLKTGTKRIDYKYFTQDWENIPELLENEDSPPVSEICAKGTWIFYENPHLINKNVTTLNGITILTSDTEQCIPINDLGHELGSVQHVTSYHKRRGDTIAFFEYENFIGRKIVVNKAKKLTSEQPGYYNLIKSAITAGKQEWLVVLDGPTRVCLKPPNDMNFPICLISNLIDDDNLVDSGVLQVYQPKPEQCTRSTSLVVEMVNCYENSASIVHPETSWPFGPPTGRTGAGEEKICEESNEILNDEHIELIGGRLNGSLGSGDWFTAIKNPKNIWKTELFDKSFQVFIKICPNSVIDTEYLMLFASLYFYHLSKIWDDGKFLNVTIPDVAWMEITHDMNSCINTVTTSGDYDNIATETSEAMKTYTSLDDITGKIENMLGYRPKNDHVMEINWLMANLVASICTKARDFDVNFLPRFLNAFHVLYFSPIEEQWSEPADYVTIYKYLFGGYGMHKTLTKIALCTYNAMKFSGVTEPYKRPMEQTNKLLLPKVETRR